MVPTVENQFLSGDYAPVRDEITLADLKVVGTIPEQLSGRYVRIGPNPIAEVNPITHHWFMGDGMAHGVRIRDGKAEWYRNRWVRSPSVAHELGEAPPKRISKQAGVLAMPVNTNVIGHGGRTLALIEGGAANYELTNTLDTVGTCDFDGTLLGGYTAHPHKDPDTGELHALSYSLAKGRAVEYSVVGTDGRAKRTVEIQTHGSPMMHDFALTKKHVVIYDLPLVLDPKQVGRMFASSLLSKPDSSMRGAFAGRINMPGPMSASAKAPAKMKVLPYRWKHDYPARIGVLPRDGVSTDIRWFDIEPCYVFHTLNAYDETDDLGNGRIVLDLIRHEKMFDKELNGPAESSPMLERWTIKLDSGQVETDRIDDRFQEFPRFDERLTSSPHRYGYCVTNGESSCAVGIFNFNAVLRHDFQAGQSIMREIGSDVSLGEVVFVPTGYNEDDGVLLGYAFDRKRGETDLVFLDAQTLETVAAVHLPVRIPVGFHGNWLSD